MAYEDALRFFRDNCNLENKEERPVEYNFINGTVVLVEDLQRDMASINNGLTDIQNRLQDLETKITQLGKGRIGF